MAISYGDVGYHTDISHVCVTSGQKGNVVVQDLTNLSYVGLRHKVDKPGNPMGVLLNDVANMDFSWSGTRYGLPYDIPVGDKVQILKHGIIRVKFDNPVKIGDILYEGPKGEIMTVKLDKNFRAIGQTLSLLDEDGWCEVMVKIQ